MKNPMENERPRVQPRTEGNGDEIPDKNRGTIPELDDVGSNDEIVSADEKRDKSDPGAFIDPANIDFEPRRSVEPEEVEVSMDVNPEAAREAETMDNQIIQRRDDARLGSQSQHEELSDKFDHTQDLERLKRLRIKGTNE